MKCSGHFDCEAEKGIICKICGSFFCKDIADQITDGICRECHNSGQYDLPVHQFIQTKDI